MLTDRQETLIEQSAPKVSEHFDAIAQRLYDILFERYPEIRPLFNESHMEAGTQQHALAGAVLAYVQWRKQPGAVRQKLAVTVDKHVALDIQPGHYPLVGECLLAAVGEQLGDDLSDDIAAAWQALYDELAALMIGLENDAKQTFAERSGGWRAWRAFDIAERRAESDDVVSFVFAPQDGQPVGDYRPGQFIGLRVVIDGEPVYRQYSLSATPNGRTYRLSIKHEPDGRVSGHLHEQSGLYRLRVARTLSAQS